MKIEWPLYLCIPPDSLVKLIEYQAEKYHLPLDILLLPDCRTRLDMKGESLKEIDRLMRQAPSQSRGESG